MFPRFGNALDILSEYCEERYEEALTMRMEHGPRLDMAMIALSICRPMCWACSMCILPRSELRQLLAPIISGSCSTSVQRAVKGGPPMELRLVLPQWRRSSSITPRNQAYPCILTF